MGSFFSMQSGRKFNGWWVSALICSVLAVQSFAQSDGQELRKVVATGAGMNEDQALKNAFTIAVQQVVGTIVDTETIVREDDTIRERILSASNGFIKSYKLIRQWQQDGLHQCSIEALVQIQQLKERLAEANISTFPASGPDLTAHDYTDKKRQADTSAILAKLINDLPNRVLGVQAHGDTVPIDSKQEGITRLKIPIIVFVDQKAYVQETAQLTTTLDKLALQRISGSIKLLRANSKYRDQGESLRTPAEQLLPNDQFNEGDNSLEGQSAKKAIDGLLQEAKQKLGTVPETPGVITLMSGVSATGSTKLSFYAMNKSTLGSLDATSPCRIVVTVALADADGAELDSSEHPFEPEDRNGQASPFVFEKGNKYRNFDGLDVRISPGLRTETGGSFLQISTSWTGDVFADIETEMLPRLKSVKLSVKWSGPNSGKTDASQRTEKRAKEHLELGNAPSPQPSSTPREERNAKSETEDPPASTESQFAASPDSTPQSVEVRSAEPVTPPPTPEAVETPDRRTLKGERYPQTRQHLLTMDDVKGMSNEQMRYAINEVYARYGATFPNVPDIQRQFQKFEWYHPKPRLTFEEVDRLMSDTERQNVKFLAQCRELKRSK
jgi:hypothetical protein